MMVGTSFIFFRAIDIYLRNTKIITISLLTDALTLVIIIVSKVVHFVTCRHSIILTRNPILNSNNNNSNSNVYSKFNIKKCLLLLLKNRLYYMYVHVCISHCSTDVKVTLFQSYCIALYCPFLGSDNKKSTFRKIRVAFNNVVRKIVGLPKRSSASAMYAQHNICNFETSIRKSIMWFYAKIGKQD